MTEMEVVSAAKESAEFSAFGTSGCHATQGIATRIVAVVATVDSSVKIKAAIEVRSVNPASPGVDIDVSRSESCPGMRVVCHHADS